jgi:hypothetical protein
MSLELVFTSELRRPATPAEEAVYRATRDGPTRTVGELADELELDLMDTAAAVTNLGRAGMLHLARPA